MTKLSMTPALLAVAAVLQLGAAAPLQAQNAVDDIRISVVDPSSDEELAVLSAEDELTMSPGDEVILRLFEPSGRNRRGLAGIFGFGPDPTPLEIVSAAPERGEATVRLTNRRDTGNRRLHIGYKIGARVALADEDLRLGRILVKSVPAQSEADNSGGGWGRGGRGDSRADRIVNALYRGILLRDPDADGSAAYRREIADRGLDRVPHVAEVIANSEESRSLRYQRGTSDEQRLTALYRELLGWNPSDADRDEWRDELAAIRRGNLADVVDEFVGTEEFRSKFGY